MKSTKYTIATQIENLLQEQKAFVFYAKPGEKNVRIIIQNNRKIYSDTTGTEPGFIFAPFNPEKQNIFFPLNKSVQSSIPKPQTSRKAPYQNTGSYTGKQKHINLVANTIRYIRSGGADKIVISKAFTLQTGEKPGTLFVRLLAHYDDAFTYLWHHPGIGMWMGATPEKLLEIKDNTLHTIALAGTKTYTKSTIWQKKEIDEQAWVSRFIQTQLQAFAKSIKVSETYTKKAGHLAHICCDIDATITKPFHIYTLLKALHPTPAVCGVPREKALKFILKNEGYDRAFYTGYLGEINYENTSDLYVNLRCMQIQKSSVSIYAGGGITRDSHALDEWNEILNKTRVLSKITNNK